MTAAGLVFVYVPLTRDGEFIEFNCTGRDGGREGERERGRERERERSTLDRVLYYVPIQIH